MERRTRDKNKTQVFCRKHTKSHSPKGSQIRLKSTIYICQELREKTQCLCSSQDRKTSQYRKIMIPWVILIPCPKLRWKASGLKLLKAKPSLSTTALHYWLPHQYTMTHHDQLRIVELLIYHRSSTRSLHNRTNKTNRLFSQTASPSS